MTRQLRTQQIRTAAQRILTEDVPTQPFAENPEAVRLYVAMGSAYEAFLGRPFSGVSLHHVPGEWTQAEARRVAEELIPA